MNIYSDGLASIRPMRMDDHSELHQAVCESLLDLILWMSWAHEVYGYEETLAWLESLPAGWEQGNNYAFAITDANKGTLVGVCGLNHINRSYRLANLGYWVRTSRRGEGFAGRAAILLASFGFEQLGLGRAEIVIAVGNNASQHVASKTGATREGLLRNRMIVRERVYNAVMYSLTPQDLGLEPNASMTYPNLE